MLKSLRALMTVSAAVIAIGAVATPALADTPWQAHHPRREQVNGRLARQNQRIHQQLREGDLNRRQAARLHSADRRIRAQERRMAARNGGYITHRQQLRINREENRVSHRIGK